MEALRLRNDLYCVRCPAYSLNEMASLREVFTSRIVLIANLFLYSCAHFILQIDF